MNDIVAALILILLNNYCWQSFLTDGYIFSSNSGDISIHNGLCLQHAHNLIHLF